MISHARRWYQHSPATLSLVCALVLPRANAAEAPAAAPKVREPAVAGLFYPRDPAALSQMIEACLAAARVEPLPGELKALVCPHAGYPYSGPVAAYAYRLLAGHTYETVVVMGPSHYAELRAASVTDAAVYRTPLGDVPVSAKARQLAALRPFALEPRCAVQRPDWWRQASHPAPDIDTAETWEHSVEVQIPFLQKTLAGFQLVPVVFGDVDPAKAAQALLPILDDRTLLIASSDLSHFYSYDRARKLDQRCVDAICRLDIDTMESQEACGRIPILTLMEVARLKGWKARLLDCRNSGDTAGDKSNVVGYAAIAFYAPPAGQFTAADRHYLLDLARRTVREAAATGKLPEVSADGLAPKFTAPKACFVTLTRRGDLRGCIGNLEPGGPLYQAIVENARSAALRDSRFEPVTPREVDQLEIEISVLTEPQPLFFSSSADLLRKLQPGVDGVVLQIGRHSATFLPQVWEQLPDKVDFLNHLAEKAGCASTAWRQPGTSVFIYHVECFKESEEKTADSR
jgi:AmmeMemoRadiSam system protein B/AmmeMemoRadiSam system protein A